MESIIKKSRTRSALAVPAPVPPTAAEPAAELAAESTERCEERLRLLRADGLVHAIEITCSCGSVTVVELDYPDGTESPR